MPFQNRVTPTGDLIAVPARGSLMGNRGCLHNAQGKITKMTDRTAWIYCDLEYKGRKQEVMAPGRYTQLFFLDEATALAAGHRPCATCKRSAYNEFTGFFKQENGVDSIAEIDAELKFQRGSVGSDLLLKDLPDGVFVRLPNSDDSWLLLSGFLYRWSPQGYCEKLEIKDDLIGLLITPESTVKVLSAGYRPHIHLSVKALVASPGEYESSLPPPEKVRKAASDEVTAEVSIPEYKNLDEVNSLNFKLKVTPRGRMLWSYFAAILTEGKMFEGGQVNLNKFFKNINPHIVSGYIKKVPGGHLLTTSGKNYFQDRHNPSNVQSIDPTLYNSMRKGLQEGGPDWTEL